MDHPHPWLKYVEADDLDASTLDFDNMNVVNAAGEALGDVNGFILDASAGQPYYVVVDSKGWFKTKHFLLPIGQAQLESDRKVLVANLSKDQVKRFPGFDLDNFAKWTPEEISRFSQETLEACPVVGVVDVTVVTTEPTDGWTSSAHYRRPDWWEANYYRPDRAGEAGVVAGAKLTDTRASE